MKVKHLLFSSLFLSAGFAACTSDVEEFNTQTPSAPVKGYEMKDLKINVTNGEFEASAETRAELSENWTASWQENDRLGAAMYSMTSVGKNAETGVLEAVGTAYHMYQDGKGYGSNSWFEYVNGTVDEFATTATCMAGAYMLYYPYNAEKTYDLDQVRVVTKDGMANDYQGLPATMEFDCEDITAAVNKNIFAANVASFVPGGSELAEFTVKQIPNLYGLTFKIKDEALLSLKEKVTIISVLMEAKNKTGNTVLSTQGYVSPEKTQPTADEYNNVPVDATDLTKGYKNIGKIKYTSEKTVERIIIDASEATQANEDYQITALGDAGQTAPYFFSALPVDCSADQLASVKFSVIVKAGEEVKVFSKTYLAEGTNKYAGWDDMDLDGDKHGIKETPGMKSLVTGMGQVVKLPVALDVVENLDTKIYTNEQFEAAWAQAKEKTSGTAEFVIARTLDLSEYDLTGLDEDVTASFSGDSVIVNDVEGKFTFRQAVRIKGNLKTTGNSIFEGNVYVEKNFEAAGNTTFKGRADIAGTVAANANVTFAADKKAKTGVITVATGKTISATCDKNDIAGITVNGGNANVDGKIGAVNVKDGGIITSTNDVAASTLTIVDGEVEANKFNAATVDVQSEGALTVNDAMKVTTKLTAAGKVTATKVNNIKEMVISSYGDVTVNGVAYGTPAVNAAIETLTVKAGTNSTGKLKANTITLVNATNNGTINATDVTVGTMDNKGKVTGSWIVGSSFKQNVISEDAHKITVNAGGIYEVNENTSNVQLINNGTVKIAGTYNNNLPVKVTTLSLHNKNASTNNGLINISGALVETAKNKLTIKDASYIEVAKNATLTLNTTSTPNANSMVELKDRTAANVTVPVGTPVGYSWSGTGTTTNAPAHDAINTIFVNGLIADGDVINILKSKNLIFKGNLTLKGDLEMATGKTVTVANSVTISSAKMTGDVVEYCTFTLDGTANSILADKTLTLSKVKLAGTPGAKLTTNVGSTVKATAKDDITISVGF